MTRTFSAVDLVHLPRVDSNGAVALASSIESAAGQFLSAGYEITAQLTGGAASKEDEAHADQDAG